MKREAITHEAAGSIDLPTRNIIWPEHHDNPPFATPADHFVERDGVQFAGTHLIIDFWGAKKLDDLQLMERTLRECVIACGATLLHIHLHHFTPNGGISGVTVLAESHISVHTWPEREFAAFDVFMCGNARPEAAIGVLKRAFSPEEINITENLRGVREHAYIHDPASSGRLPGLNGDDARDGERPDSPPQGRCVGGMREL